MAKAFGLRGSNEIFKEFYGRGYRQFEFKKPGVFARGFYFGGPAAGAGYNRQARSPLDGNLGKISRYLLQKISGLQLPEDGNDILDHLYLSPQQALQGGPYAYYLRQKSKKLVVKYRLAFATASISGWLEWGKTAKAGENPATCF